MVFSPIRYLLSSLTEHGGTIMTSRVKAEHVLYFAAHDGRNSTQKMCAAVSRSLREGGPIFPPVRQRPW